jgi:hypothetical protein
MQCPYCDYEHWEWDDEKETFSEGNLGDFFRLPLEITRSIHWEPDESKSVVGCPNCNKIFMKD